MIQLRGATTFSFNMQKKWLSYKPVACTILRRQNLSTMLDKLSTSESAGWFLEGNNKKTGKISTIGHFLMPYFFLNGILSDQHTIFLNISQEIVFKHCNI